MDKIKEALEYLKSNTITGHLIAIDILEELLRSKLWNISTKKAQGNMLYLIIL